MSRDEATCYKIGVFLPQNPFSHKLCIFQVLLFIQQLGSLSVNHHLINCTWQHVPTKMGAAKRYAEICRETQIIHAQSENGEVARK